MKLTLTQQEAKFAHQKHYAGDFEVIEIKRSGYFNFFPFSMVYGISDFGGWDGLISTDGKKVVVTKSKYFDKSKIDKTFTFPLSNIVSSDMDRTIGKNLKLIRPEKGLTRTKLNGLIKLIGMLSVWGLPVLFIYEKFLGRNTYFVFGITEDYDSLGKIRNLLPK